MRDTNFGALAERLRRAGVAPRHVRRTVGELEAHLQDLTSELSSRGVSFAAATLEARARLGTDDALAASVLARPELRSWARRRPWAAFALIPVVFFLAALAGAATGFVVLLSALKSVFGIWLQQASVLQPVTQLFLTATLWVLPCMAAALCAAVALRYRVGVAWPIAGVVLIAIIGALANMSLETPAPPAKMSFSAGFGINEGNAVQALLRAGVTMLLVLVPFLAWRRARTAH